MSWKSIVALDPGGTTGWAALTYDKDIELEGGFDTARSKEGYTWEYGHIGPHEHHTELWNFLNEYYDDSLTVVCESFEFRQGKQRTGINLMSKEYIGVTKLFGDRHGIPVVFQTAAHGKGFVTDEKIKCLDLWVPGKKHAMDAMRHLLTYVVQKERRFELVRPWKEL